MNQKNLKAKIRKRLIAIRIQIQKIFQNLMGTWKKIIIRSKFHYIALIGAKLVDTWSILSPVQRAQRVQRGLSGLSNSVDLKQWILFESDTETPGNSRRWPVLRWLIRVNFAVQASQLRGLLLHRSIISFQWVQTRIFTAAAGLFNSYLKSIEMCKLG